MKSVEQILSLRLLVIDDDSQTAEAIKLSLPNHWSMHAVTSDEDFEKLDTQIEKAVKYIETNYPLI